MKLVKKKIEKYNRSSAIYLLWQTADGGNVESSVLYIANRKIPWVLCLPSSIGCSMGCSICSMPHSLTPKKLNVEDVFEIVKYSLSENATAGKFQISFMGQGEPLLNRINIFDFCDKFSAKYPQAMIGISTVGITEGITELSKQGWASKVKLQLSLHSIIPIVRKKLIPVEKLFPISASIKESEKFSIKFKRRVCLNITLIDGINDKSEHANKLASSLSNNCFYIKLSKFNRFNGINFRPSPKEKVSNFYNILSQKGFKVNLFKSIGNSIGAGCGQTKISQISDSTGSDTINLSKIPNSLVY